MAKKSAAAEFNMSEAIRDIFTENPQSKASEAIEAIVAKYPHAKINKNSFSVAFYTTRKKLGIGGSKRGRPKVGVKRSIAAKGRTIDIGMLQSAAKFLSEIGSKEAALEAIRQVQAVQVN